MTAAKSRFRAALKSGREDFCGRRSDIRLIATPRRFSGFQGLPIVDCVRSGDLPCRPEAGGGGVYTNHIDPFLRCRDGELFAELGSFPSVNSHAAGLCASCSQRRSVITSTACTISAVVDSNDPFESFSRRAD